MMTSDTMWGGNPHRAHNLGMRPFYEANKVGARSLCSGTHRYWCLAVRIFLAALIGLLVFI